MGGIISRGFRGRRLQPDVSGRLPPGQYLTTDFPVLSAGPTPNVNLETWSFGVTGEVEPAKRWTWEEFNALPTETFTVDIHCVTKWSKLDTTWTGVSRRYPAGRRRHVGRLRRSLTLTAATPQTSRMEDVTGGKAWVVHTFDGEPLEPRHGGPARLLVPHLYFWKSAKWVRGLELRSDDEPGFWESLGYHNYGDPWQEQRYWGD